VAKRGAGAGAGAGGAFDGGLFAVGVRARVQVGAGGADLQATLPGCGAGMATPATCASTYLPFLVSRPVHQSIITNRRALHQTPDFEAGLRHMLVLGGDVDTNAAIVGAALGALHGAAAIPARLRGPVVARSVGAAGRPRPAFLQGDVAEGMVRRLFSGGRGAADGGGGANQ
jgi:hypothetical protein